MKSDEKSTKSFVHRIFLIHPPVVRPCEPPAGISALIGSLRSQGHDAHAWDANLEGILALLHAPTSPAKDIPENNTPSPAFSGYTPHRGDSRQTQTPSMAFWRHTPHRGDIPSKYVSSIELFGYLPAAEDTWTSRAARDLKRHLADIKTGEAFLHRDTYSRIIGDLNRLLSQGPWTRDGWRLSLTDAEHQHLKPTRSTDLLAAAAKPELNPFFPVFSRRLDNLLAERNPSLIGISVNYLSQALTAFAMAGFLRRIAPGVSLIAGGGLITSWMARPNFQNPFQGLFDRLFSGPGEHAFQEFLTSGGIPEKNVPSSHSSPLPDFSDLPLDLYLSPRRILPFSTSRGCWWAKCSFCPETSEKSGFKTLSPAKTLSHLHELRDRFNPGLFHLIDNAITPPLLQELAQSSIQTPWYGFARLTAPLTDPDFCRLLKNSGCVMLQLGLESGDQGILDRLCKGVSLDEAGLILKNLADAGIATYVYLLFGTPWETPAAARKTLDFVVRHHSQIQFLNLAIFNLPVYSSDASNLRTFPFYEGDLNLYWDFEHPQQLGRREVRRFLDQEFRRHPALGQILQRDPPAFTSSHAPFFLPGFSPFKA